MKRLFLLLFTFFSLSANEFEFKGIHFIASYKKCNKKRLKKLDSLIATFLISATGSGATIIKHDSYEFNNKGLTAYALLSESHASIHTYPEHSSCFVDLFTCGNTCNWERFDTLMQQYLQPAEVKSSKIIRD